MVVKRAITTICFVKFCNFYEISLLVFGNDHLSNSLTLSLIHIYHRFFVYHSQ